jgi:hypothetical protein
MYIMIPSEDSGDDYITVTDVDQYSLYEFERVYRDHSLRDTADRLKAVIVRPILPDPPQQGLDF